MSSYAESVLKAVREMSIIMEKTMFTGWVRGHFENFSRCCSAIIYVNSLMEGIPYCTKCRHSLGPDDLRREWVPPHPIDADAQAGCPWPMEPE